jgi:hypothetical protein
LETIQKLANPMLEGGQENWMMNQRKQEDEFARAPIKQEQGQVMPL